jgi:hypothetical protein
MDSIERNRGDLPRVGSLGLIAWDKRPITNAV